MKKLVAAIILVPLAFLIVIGAIVGSPEEGSAQEATAEKFQRKAGKEAKPEPTVKPVSAAKMNALSSAQVYLTTMPFSKEGLRNQLSYEGYNDAASAYAV
ncbi:MAG: Ltp family lipoprotein, partial [SAR202 cluster bacterium]|nr:Ltp family lipoprotein [SAR202 cluster bacterium]